MMGNGYEFRIPGNSSGRKFISSHPLVKLLLCSVILFALFLQTCVAQEVKSQSTTATATQNATTLQKNIANQTVEISSRSGQAATDQGPSTAGDGTGPTIAMNSEKTTSNPSKDTNTTAAVTPASSVTSGGQTSTNSTAKLSEATRSVTSSSKENSTAIPNNSTSQGAEKESRRNIDISIDKTFSIGSPTPEPASSPSATAQQPAPAFSFFNSPAYGFDASSPVKATAPVELTGRSFIEPSPAPPSFASPSPVPVPVDNLSPVQPVYNSPPVQPVYTSPPVQPVYNSPPAQPVYNSPPVPQAYYPPSAPLGYYPLPTPTVYSLPLPQPAYYVPPPPQYYSAPQLYYAPPTPEYYGPPQPYYAIPPLANPSTSATGEYAPQPAVYYSSPPQSVEYSTPASTAYSPPLPVYYAPPPPSAYYSAPVSVEYPPPVTAEYVPPLPEVYSPPPPPAYYPPSSPAALYTPPPPPAYYSAPAVSVAYPPAPAAEYAPALPEPNYSPLPPPAYYSPPFVAGGYSPPPVEVQYAPPPPPAYYSPPRSAGEYPSPPVAVQYAPPAPPAYYSPPPVTTEYPAPATPVYYPSAAPAVEYPPPAPVEYAPPPAVYYAPAPVPAEYPPLPPAVELPVPPPPSAYYPPPAYNSKPQDDFDEYYHGQEHHVPIPFLQLNQSLVCGILPAVSADLYQNSYDLQEYQRGNSPYGTALVAKKDVLPFGESPWTVLITDDYNNVVCQGVIVHNRQILTLASCVNGEYPLEKLRVRYGDWDLLNNVNEYEAYKNYESRICGILPVKCPKCKYDNSAIGGDLILLQVELVEDYDKYPQIKPVCLPLWAYNPSPRSKPPYNVPSKYSVASYSPPPPPPYSAPPPRAYRQAAYSPTPSYAPVYSEPVYSECWVAGYHASPKTELKNHQPPQGSPNVPNGYKASGDSYYPEKSLIPRKAKVKKVPAFTRTYGHGHCEAEEQRWVGVDGFDACVADKGAPIVCIVDEHISYGFYGSSYASPSYSSYQPPPRYAPYEYSREISANPPQAEMPRKRAVVVAVVQDTASCANYENKGYSYGGYDRLTSNPISATRISERDVTFIVDKFWEGALDYSCPAPVSYYPTPNYYPETKPVSPLAPVPYSPLPPVYSAAIAPPSYAPAPRPEYYPAPQPQAPQYYQPPPPPAVYYAAPAQPQVNYNNAPAERTMYPVERNVYPNPMKPPPVYNDRQPVPSVPQPPSQPPTYSRTKRSLIESIKDFFASTAEFLVT